MMNNVQGDCKHGSTGFPAGEDLTLATGRLAKLNADGHVVLPTADTDITPYVVTCGADQGYLCGVFPLTSIANSRVVLKGACQTGQLLVAVGDGRVEAGVPDGAALPVGVAEEDGVEGQHVLLRPLCVGARGAAGEAGAAGAAGPAGEAGAAGAPGAAGARGAAESVGFITESLIAGTFVGSGQVLFFGPDTTDGTYRWIHDPAFLLTRVMMGLVTEAVDPAAAEVVYRLKVLVINGVSWRTVSVPVQYITGTELGISLWGWVDAFLHTPDVGSAYYRLALGYSGACNYYGLHAASAVGDEILCVSEISA